MSVKVKDVLDALQQMQKSLECSICLELLKDPHSTKCNHQFCGQCIRQVLEKSSKKSKNKWYCPLCKTPVSKRSLTPNPKLNEIVAAVRNLQGAVQDDTGIPTGSPPSQPLKGPNTDVNSSVVCFSVPQPTPRKNATGRKGRRKASRDHFTVYIEKNENFGHALESHPPQIVSNVNIRSSLRPLPVTQTQTKAKKSAKTETTRKTRNSRRIQEQKSLPEDTDVGRNSNDDLLHLIDTMTFKPVFTEGSSKDFILDPQTEEKLTPSDNSSPSTTTLSTLKEDAGEKDDCKLNPSMPKEKPVCLTTIAAADSSISINPCSSTGLFEDQNVVNCENTANRKENIVAVTSSKIADSTLLCIPQSTSLDTMQSVSILQSLEVQPHDSAGGFCNESDVEDNQQNDVTTYQGDETDELVANEKCDVENREEMYDETRGNACGENPIDDDHEANFKRRNKENKQILGSIPYTENYEKVRDVLPNSIPAKIPEIENHCIEGNNLSSTVICDSAIQEKPAGNYEERETHDKRLSQPSDTILPHENVKSSAEQSLDFEGLVSLFDEPSHSTSQDAMHKEETAQNSSSRLDKAAGQLQQAHALDKEKHLGQSLEAVQQVETVNNISSSSTPKGKKTSPRQKGRGLANLQDSEDSGDSSDLCERVKQRQRRGTSKMLLTESPTTSLTTELKPKKRTVDSMSSFKTRDESCLEGSAKKKFKTSEVPSPSQLSSEKPNTARKKTPRNSEVSSNQKQTEDLVATDCDERSQSYQSEMVNYSCSTDKSIDSNELIPASVSSSENSKSAVIDPMDVYADQTHEEKKEVASKRKESLKLHKIKERGIFVKDYSSDLKTAEGRSQDERQHSSAPQVKNAVDHDESTQGFTPSPKLSFPSQKLKDSTSGQSLINELKTSHLAESLPFDQSQKASFDVTEQRSQLYEEDFVDQERLITGQDHTAFDEDTHVQRKTLRTPQCSSGINSLKGKDTGDTKNNTMEKGKYSSQLAENRSKTCKPLSQEGCTSSGTPTQCSLETGDLTPCLFGNDSCETPVSQKRTKRVETLLQEVIEEHNGGMNDAEIEEIGVLDDSETPGATGLLSGSQKAASLQTGSDGTQSFGTSQSISVLHDLDVPSQGQQEGTARRDDPSEPAFHAEHSNKETESDKAWAEPLRPRSKQQPESQGMELNMSNCHGKKKTNGSELTESEIIPPTPPVKTVTKHVFDVHAQSPLKLTSPKRNVNETSKATCHSKSLTVKRKRSIRSPRCSNSPKLPENNDDGTAMHVSSSFSKGSEVNVSVLENHDRSSISADIKGLSQAMEFEVGTSASSEQQRVNLSQTNTETLVHGSKINANKTPKRLRRLDTIQKQGTYSESISPRVLDGPRLSQSEANRKVSKYDNVGREDLRDSPSAEVESVHSSPRSLVKRRLDHMSDSFDWSGTRTVQKRGGHSQYSPVALNNCDNNAEHLRGKEVKDCYVDQLNSPNASQARDETEDSLEDFLTKSEAKGELANPFVGNIRVRNSCCVVDEEISLTDAEEEDSSGDESLLKPAFLPKESRKSPESQIDNTHDSDDEDEEVTVFSQELIPSENEDDDDDGASCKALDSTGASTSTFLSEAAASTQRVDVLRQDVEAMEKEMEKLRAYLAKTDEDREDEEHTLKEDDINYQEAGLVDDGDIQPSLTPPPPLTPKSIPPMPQLSTPLKNVSRYLEQEGQSSDEGSECEDATSSEPVKRTELPRRFGYQRNKSTTERLSSGEKSGKKRPLSPSDDDDDGLSITEVERRQEETPSPPRSNHSMERSQEKDEDKLIVIDDRDGPQSRTGSLLLVKRRKLTHDLVPKKSPVVSLLFTRAGKGLEKPGQSLGTRSKGSSPTMKKSSSSIYSRKPGTSISPIRGQSPTKTGSLIGVSRDNLSKKNSSHNGVSRDDASNTSVSHSNVAREKLSHERSHSPDLVLTNVKQVTSKKSLDNKREDRTTDRQLSFVATRLNRQQLAEARTLAEMYGGKLASEFNRKTSHVIMTTDENMQVTRHSYTMKYLLGLALGKWIVSHRWIAACNQANSLVSEVDYEVKGDAGLGQASIPRVARTARSNKEAPLFEDYEVLCLGEFSAAVTKEQLSQLLRFCGASVFADAESMKRTEKGRQRVVTIDKETRDNAKELKAICRQLNKKPVSLEWVTDSIANYKVQDLKDYIVEL